MAWCLSKQGFVFDCCSLLSSFHQRLHKSVLCVMRVIKEGCRCIGVIGSKVSFLQAKKERISFYNKIRFLLLVVYSIRTNSIRFALLIQWIQKPSKPSNVLRQLSRSFGNIVVPPIGNPPWISLQMIGSCLVHAHSLRDGDFLVQSSVYDHDGTLGLSDAVDVGINIEAGQSTIEIDKINERSVRNNVSTDKTRKKIQQYKIASLTGSVSALAFHS